MVASIHLSGQFGTPSGSLSFDATVLKGSQANFTLGAAQTSPGAAHHHHHHHHWNPDGPQSGQNPTDGQNCNQSDCQPWQGPAQNMIDHGNQLVQKGEQDIKDGNVGKGMREINHGMDLINRGTSQLAAQQPTQPVNQFPSVACSSNNGQSSDPLSVFSQILNPLLSGGSGGGLPGGFSLASLAGIFTAI